MKKLTKLTVTLISMSVMIGCKNTSGNEEAVVEESVEVVAEEYMEAVVDESVEPTAEEYVEEDVKSDPKKFCTSQLELFALVGDVHKVQYDSLHLVYNTIGELEFFGFNDSINLLQDAEYCFDNEYRRLMKWGANDWKFENRSNISYLPYEERPMEDFLIYYPEGGYDRYLTEFKYRPDTPKREDRDYKQNRCRKYAVASEYRNFRRKGEYPQPDIFVYDQYVYDEYGNWVERRVKSNHRRTKHEKRIITYYSQE